MYCKYLQNWLKCRKTVSQKHIFATQTLKRYPNELIQFDFEAKVLKLLKLMPNQRV